MVRTQCLLNCFTANKCTYCKAQPVETGADEYLIDDVVVEDPVEESTIVLAQLSNAVKLMNVLPKSFISFQVYFL